MENCTRIEVDLLVKDESEGVESVLAADEVDEAAEDDEVDDVGGNVVGWSTTVNACNSSISLRVGSKPNCNNNAGSSRMDGSWREPKDVKSGRMEGEAEVVVAAAVAVAVASAASEDDDSVDGSIDVDTTANSFVVDDGDVSVVVWNGSLKPNGGMIKDASVFVSNMSGVGVTNAGEIVAPCPFPLPLPPSAEDELGSGEMPPRRSKWRGERQELETEERRVEGEARVELDEEGRDEDEDEAK